MKDEQIQFLALSIPTRLIKVRPLPTGKDLTEAINEREGLLAKIAVLEHGDERDNVARILADKVLLYLGDSLDHAVMTFVEDGSTWQELIDLAKQVRGEMPINDSH